MLGLARNSSELLKTFHKDVSTRASMTGTGIASLPMLEHQLKNYENIFQELTQTAKKTLDERQRDINREFVPVISKAMEQVYEVCTAERGKSLVASYKLCPFRVLTQSRPGCGSFARMKRAMIDHVSLQRNVMFRTSCEDVRQSLRKVVSKVKEDMEMTSDEIFSAINRDYRSALGRTSIHGEVMPRWQRDMRKAVMDIIETAECVLTDPADIKLDRFDGDFDSKHEEQKDPDSTDEPSIHDAQTITGITQSMETPLSRSVCVKMESDEYGNGGVQGSKVTGPGHVPENHEAQSKSTTSVQTSGHETGVSADKIKNEALLAPANPDMKHHLSQLPTHKSWVDVSEHLPLPQ